MPAIKATDALELIGDDHKFDWNYKNRYRASVRFLCYKILWITIKCSFCVL